MLLIILSLTVFFKSQTSVVFVFVGIPVFVIKMSLRNKMDFSCLLKILKLQGIFIEKESLKCTDSSVERESAVWVSSAGC